MINYPIKLGQQCIEVFFISHVGLHISPECFCGRFSQRHKFLLQQLEMDNHSINRRRSNCLTFYDSINPLVVDMHNVSGLSGILLNDYALFL